MTNVWTVWGDNSNPVAEELSYEEMVKLVNTYPNEYYGINEDTHEEYEVN